MPVQYTSDLDRLTTEGLKAAADAAGIVIDNNKPKAKAAPVEREVPEGYVLASSVIQFAEPLPPELDIPVPMFKDEDWPEHMRPRIPDPEDHIFPVEETIDMLAGLALGRPTLITGPKGSGKSSTPKQICARLRIPFVKVGCKEDMTSDSFFGGIDPATMDYKEGSLIEVARYGGLFCIDEAMKMPAGIAASLMQVLERDKHIYLTDKPGDIADRTVTPAKNFWIFATDNTVGQGDVNGKYVSSNVQDEAWLDRFAVSVYLGFLKPEYERKVILAKFPATPPAFIDGMLKMANLIREAYDNGTLAATMSPRGLLDWAEQSVFWGNEKRAFRTCHFNKQNEDDRRLLAEFYHSVFGEHIS